jgi:hypothetical protein
VVEVHVTPRAREDHDAESHEASSSVPDFPLQHSRRFYYVAVTRTRRRAAVISCVRVTTTTLALLTAPCETETFGSPHLAAGVTATVNRLSR